MAYAELLKYGLTDFFIEQAGQYEGLYLARITEQHRQLYRSVSEESELNAVVAGRLAYAADGALGYPAVGDWVMLDRPDDSNGNAVIQHVLRRRSIFARRAAGTSAEQQAVAANIDVVFICMSLNADFNLRRVERYLAVAWDSMATPVIVLTKADLCADLAQKLSALAPVSIGTDVITCSSMSEDGYREVSAYIVPGRTIAFIGSSGVGKSTLINRLLGRELLGTGAVRADDDRGRHVTTHRQLLLLPGGGIVIDTPGMRELQLYTGDLAKAFEDIEELAAGCRYADCAHGSEPGCMVRRAIAEGELSQARFESYQKLQRELTYDGLNSRQLENEKINRMFGGKGQMKQTMKYLKDKNHKRNGG